ncbi:chemotaxis protein CheA [bacterium]|nr:chemotaxis protein CheA [bacterium]
MSLDQFKQTYITECYELLEEMENLLVALDCDAADAEQLNAIFRCAHSIKGGSGAFGLTYITDFTHVLEALLDGMREGKVAPSREAVDTLLKAVDIVTRMVDAAKANITPPESLGEEVLQSLKSIAGNTQSLTAQPKMHDAAQTAELKHYEITFAPHAQLYLTGNEPLLLLQELKRLGETNITAYTGRVPTIDQLNPGECYLSWQIRLSGEIDEAAIREVFEFVEDYCDLTIKEAPALPVAGEENNAPPFPAHKITLSTGDQQDRVGTQTTSIRVDLDKVDRLVNMVGELVITEAMLRAQTRDLPAEKFVGLMRGVDELSQHTRELQEAVMAVRMQPVKSVFSRMPRIVRDLSAQLGKDIRLEMSGENTEVDKTVIESLSDPLTHMIRNSVDHGIEAPDLRLASGKPAQGTIHLSADHRGGRIVLEIRDDGAGINRERVLAKAREKGLVAEDAQLTEEECDNLIFLPGFSTAEKVSNVSGRGVGMDVVRRNIESLEGTVKLTTQPGKGSLFTISLPLTLAILDGMIVRVGAEHYIIPITSIIETMRPKPGEVKSVEGHAEVLNVRGEFIPIIYIHRIFSIEKAEADPAKALVVLVEGNGMKLGLVVDELIGQQQVVIKSLEANADPVKGISGATILGDGRVSLILDINGLKALHQQKPHLELVA